MYQNTQHTFNSHDGIALFYQHWQTDRAFDTDKKAIVMLHRGHEHSGRMAHLV